MNESLVPELPDFDDPLGVLRACHERMLAHCEILRKLPAHIAANGVDDEARSAVNRVVSYFSTSAAHHHQDEEQDLFPLLRRHAEERGRAEVLAALDELAREHRTMDEVYGRIRQRLADVAEARSARLDIEQVAHFAWIYRRHIMREEAAAFGFAAEALTDGERAGLGARMAQRRGVARR